VIHDIIHAHFNSTALTESDTLLDTQRLIKDPDETDILRKAAAITDKVMDAVVPLIREGVTQIDLEEAIRHYGRQFGADDVSFSPGALFVLSGSEVSENPFTYPKDTGLLPGTSVAFDFGFLVDGYCSDFGRSFYFGPAEDEVKNAYHALGRSMEELAGLMHENSMTTGDLFPAIEKILDGYGFGDYLRARLKTGNLGHQIGIDVHENPWLTPESDTPLAAGMVMAIEPKLWHAGEYYLRMEDIVVVGQDNTEFLTTFDRELFQL
jgi:Xaa-Pro aminopeptidase